ncbi:RadC family protein [Thiopseudomonas denitrificans]|uniref:DNA repair protein RadC n=1 Tax=Thiopseudomonas denitrificans TaxID=1501432 RepID=A0A4R6TYJ2_9GAMM|nr:DNA repair protein RadC [Thiopseudomonas denitrificans]TDQ37005.1 DNA repair protein RadC [Thiopseudomonas denitrificans]
MQYHKLKSGQEPGTYIMENTLVTEEDILTIAKQLSRKRLSRGRAITNATDVKEHLRNLMHEYESEVFAILLLDTKHRILAFKELFYGTIDGASVYPREIVKLALQHNAAAAILVHNHPSGDSTPSQADKLLTKRLKEALGLVDVRVLDHIVVGTEGATSMVEYGWM